MYRDFHPTVCAPARLATPRAGGIAAHPDVRPLRAGMFSSKCDFDGQLQLGVANHFSRCARRAVGYIGEVKLYALLFLAGFSPPHGH